MEYKVNDYIDIQPLYEDKVLVLNKRNGQSYELGNKESAVLALIDGKRTPLEISEICGFFSEEEIISLEKQLLDIDILCKGKKPIKLNLLKVKIPIFNPNHLFKDSKIINTFYYLFTATNVLFIIVGIVSAIVNLLKGISDEKRILIQSISSFQQFKSTDIIYIIVFFLFSLILHEFGHMIIARKNKINVPDVGIMLYLFIPCAYTNLTFLNYCNDKKVKLAVFGAGSLSDCGLLGISMALFHLYAPLMISKYFLIASLICMVSIIGNIVVTFKFDGYYILQTLLDINNLKKTALGVIIVYMGTLFSKFKNRDKKLELRQCGATDKHLEFVFSVMYIFLSVIYIPVMIGSGIIMSIIQWGGKLL